MKLKNILSFLLVLACFATILSSCSEETKDAGEISNYDSQAFIPIEDTSGESTEYSKNTTQTGGFVVSDKMYDFEGNNLVVLNVENQTSKNYSITINGTYLDENSEILKEEAKTFTGFAAGWKNNFFFVPNISFAKFVYTLDVEEYVGECYASIFTVVWQIEKVEGVLDHLNYQSAYAEWERNGRIDADYPEWDDYTRTAIVLNVREEYETEELLEITEGHLVLSESGAVIAVPGIHQTQIQPDKVQGGGWRSISLLFAEDKDDFEFDPVWDGDLTVLLSITEARLYDPVLDSPIY